MRRKGIGKEWLVSILAMMLVASVALVGCAPSEVPTPAPPEAPTPEFKGEIVWGLITDFTGPLAPSGKDLTAGDRDAIKYINEELGGVAGVKIEPVVIDCAYDVSREVAAFAKLLDVHKAMYVGLISSSSVPALIGKATEKQIVLTGSPEPAGLFAPNSYFYTPFPMWADMQLGGLDWWVENEWKGSGSPRVGIASIDAQPGWSHAKRTRDHCERKGYTYVGEAMHPVAVVEQSAEVATMKRLKPDIILAVSHDTGHLTWLREWEASGTPGVAQIHHWCLLPESTLKSAGTSAEGVFSYYPFRMVGFDQDNTGLRLLKEYARERGWDLPTPLYMMGFTRTLMIAEGMRMALEKVGFENLDGAAINDALSQLKGYNCLGLTPDINLSPTEHRGYEYTRLVRILPGAKYEPVTDFIPVPPLTPEEKTGEYYKGK